MCGPEHPDCDCATRKTANPGATAVTTTTSTGTTAAPVVLTAAADRDAETGLPTRWHAVVAVEGLRTTDHRAVAKGALDWRQLPLAFFVQTDNDGHQGASLAGQITSITRDEATGRIMGEGTFDLGSEDGREAARLCDEQILRWVSMDLEVLESQLIEVGVDDGGDMLDLLFGESEGADDWYEEVTSGRIMGATMVSFPAFPQCVIAPVDVELEVPDPMGTAPMVEEGLIAAGIEMPPAPPASWFTDPRLDEPTPLTIDNDGHVYGHLALWGTCHTGIANACVRPSRSESDYAYFRTGQIEAKDGTRVRVGQITFDTGHAGATMGWQDTTAHYDHTGAAAADVAVGEDDFGIWFAGALRPGITGEDLLTVRASALSGDWRKIGGRLELVAALAVNVPGYPIVASAGKRGDEQVSLVAAGVPRRNPLRELAREVEALRAAVAPLLPLAAEQLRSRVSAAHTVTIAEPIDIEDLRNRVRGKRSA